MDPQQQSFTVHAHTRGPIRNATIAGVEFAVQEVVLLRSQVLHNNLGSSYVSNAELAASVEEWNGVDIVIRHPTRNGEYVSAREPEIIDNSGVGRLWRSAYFEEDGVGVIRAEAWVAMGRLEEADGGDQVLAMAEANTTVPVSTGLTAMARPAPEGADYDHALTDLRSDHLALLVDGDDGACSVNDGCGMQLAVARRAAANPPGGLVARVAAWVGRALVMDAEGPELQDLRNDLRLSIESLYAEEEDVWVHIEAWYQDEVVWGLETPEGMAYFRAPWSLADDMSPMVGEPQKVVKTTVFEPVNNSGTNLAPRHTFVSAPQAPDEGGGNMTREELINSLCDCEQVGLRREVLEAMTDEELAAQANLRNAAAEGGGDPEPEPEPAPAGTDADDGPAEANTEALNRVSEALAATNARLDAIEADLGPQRQANADRREALVNSILEATGAYTEEHLESEGLQALQRLANALEAAPAQPPKTADFSLQASAPTRPAPRGKVDLGWTPRSTIQPKEA